MFSIEEAPVSTDVIAPPQSAPGLQTTGLANSMKTSFTKHEIETIESLEEVL